MKHEAEQFDFPAVTPPAAHHQHGMSKLNYLAACPGYESRGGTSEAAEDGTRLHDIMEEVVQITIADMARNGVLSAVGNLQQVLAVTPVSEEEEFHLTYCCKELDFWLAKKPLRLATEERLYIHNPDGTELNFGHFDLLIFLTEETAILFDYKFGWLPVPPAAENWQGKGYAVGAFQKLPQLKKLGVVFIQPKLHATTRCSYDRAGLFKMYQEVRDVIRNALRPEKSLRPGPYCDFCGIASTCKALLNEAQRAVAIHENLPMPQSFIGLQIETPEEAARALYVVDRLQLLIEESGLKVKAKELARLNDGKLSCDLGNGQTVHVELKERNAPRSANSPILIAEALQNVLTQDQVLGACDLKITRLEPIFADALVAKANAEANSVLNRAEEIVARDVGNGFSATASEIRAAAKAKAKAIRITKKRAVEILSDTLTSEGLLSAPDGRVEYLKVRIEKHTKQLETNDSQSNH